MFSLIMLGTDTDIEGLNPDGSAAQLPGYERGETLNAIFRALDGDEFKDKHIVSGPRTRGLEFDQKVAEGVLMTLKAISEGKTTIKIAAHSRGAVETIILTHQIQKILDLVSKNVTKENFKKEVLSIITTQTDRTNAKVTCIDTSEPSNSFIKFKTSQSKTTNSITPDERLHEINMESLLSAIKEPTKIECELFLIDPVPGQHGTSNWYLKDFFEIPPVAKKIEIIYKKHERTAFFEPILPKSIPENCDFKITPLPGHHGTASGFLDNQGSESKDIIQSETEDATKGKRGKKTRHVQKLMIGKLVQFFEMKSVNPHEKKEKQKRDKAPSIEKTITSCREKNNSPEEMKKFFLKRYEKTNSAIEEFKRFEKTTYAGLSMLSGAKRSVLTGLKSSQLFDDIEKLHTPPGGFVNNEHIILTLEGQIDTTNTSADFLQRQFEFFTQCFSDPTSRHQDKNGISKGNSEVINFFCKHDAAIHLASGYFYTLINSFSAKILTALLDSNQADSDHEKNVAEHKAVAVSVKKLLEAIKSYSTNSKNPHFANAAKLHEELINVQKSIYEYIKTILVGKKNNIENHLKIIKANEDSSLPEKINTIITNRNSILFLSHQHHFLKNAELINEENFTQLTKELQSLETKYSEYLQNVIDDQKLKQTALLHDFKEKIGILSSIPITESHAVLQNRINEARNQALSDSEFNLDFDLLNNELSRIQAEYQEIKAANAQKADAIRLEKESTFIKPTELQNADVTAQAIINDLFTNYNETSNNLTAELTSFNIKLNQEIAKKENELKQASRELAEIQRIIQLQKSMQKKNAKIAELRFNYSFNDQLRRLEYNLGTKDPHSPEGKLQNQLYTEFRDTRLNPADEVKLAHTLLVVNKFIEASPEDKDYDSLAQEAEAYTNSSSKTYQRIGIYLTALAALSIAAAITISALTLGIGVIPLATIYAAALIGTFSAIGASSGTAAGFTLFASKQPRIYHALKDAAEQKPIKELTL